MSIKLLVADDSITIQKVIGIIFGGEEYSLTVVDNGKTAIEKAREICPDVLLIDALMPGMTGYEVAEAIRATPALSNKPILILTGSFEPFDEDKARKCGADDFLAKPFESQQIINKVKELSELGLARGNSAAPTQQPEAPTAPVVSEAVQTSTPFTESFIDSTPKQEVAAPDPQVSTDIWNAFTFEPETPEPTPAVTAPATTASVTPEVSSVNEPDVFSIVNEESGSAFIQTDEAVKAPVQNIGSQWVPVEENTFEFEEEEVPALTPPSSPAQPEPSVTQSFGDISFEDDEPATVPSTAPVGNAPAIEPTAEALKQPIETDVFTFEEPLAAFAPQQSAQSVPPEQPQASFMEEPVQPVVAVIPEAVQAAVTPVSEPTPTALSEEQLKAALSSASKEVIERIVWEVVPDLAEAMIKEAIRKIKEGI